MKADSVSEVVWKATVIIARSTYHDPERYGVLGVDEQEIKLGTRGTGHMEGMGYGPVSVGGWCKNEAIAVVQTMEDPVRDFNRIIWNLEFTHKS